MSDAATDGRGDLAERVQRLEFLAENAKERLAEGAEAFAVLRQDQQPTPTWKMIGMGLTILVLLAGWVWQAAKYPNRDEFDDVRREVTSLKIDQAKIQADVAAIKESQKRVEQGIDEIKDDLRDK